MLEKFHTMQPPRHSWLAILAEMEKENMNAPEYQILMLPPRDEVDNEVELIELKNKRHNQGLSLDGEALRKNAERQDLFQQLPKQAKGIKLPNAVINNIPWIKTDFILDHDKFEIVTDFETNDFVQYVIDSDDKEEGEKASTSKGLQSIDIPDDNLGAVLQTDGLHVHFTSTLSARVKSTTPLQERYISTNKRVTTAPVTDLAMTKKTGTGTSRDKSLALWTPKVFITPRQRLGQYRK